jgi:DMSO/TMAO reductase YedYZ molybdopterin-dependent catalytic subunit
MSKLITRRKWITGGLTLSAGVASVALGNRFGLIPPDYSGLFGPGETVTYAAHRLLLSGQPLAREFRLDQISTHFPAINTTLPGDDFYREQMVAGFREWTLPIDGLVARPGEFTLAQLKSFPSRTQITQHVCEQGWSAIAEWTGVPLSTVLHAAGIRPEAKYVVLYTIDDWWDSLDMADAFHPQTLLAYGMNGHDLPVPHGAPVRLRVERQLGYKNLKYVSQITVTDTVKDIGKGKGAVGAENGYAWYAGI